MKHYVPDIMCEPSKSSILVDSSCHYYHLGLANPPLRGLLPHEVPSEKVVLASFFRMFSPFSTFLMQTQGSPNWMSKHEPVSNFLTCTCCVPSSELGFSGSSDSQICVGGAVLPGAMSFWWSAMTYEYVSFWQAICGKGISRRYKMIPQH